MTRSNTGPVPWINQRTMGPISLETGRKVGCAAAGMPEAVDAAERFLADGQWKATSALRLIALAYHCSFAAVCEAAALADSDSGSFICRPTEETPLLAPDECDEWSAMTPPERRIMVASDRRAARDLLNDT